MKQRKVQTPQEIIAFLRSFKNYIRKPYSMSPQSRCQTNVQTAKKMMKNDHLLKSPTDRQQNTEFVCEGIEKKVESLAIQIKDLQTKQEQLENQHYQLSMSVKKLTQDKKHQLQERSQMIKKLDQMIDIQLKQEENLNQFKQLFASRKLIN
ncbi:unnamed protein product [Paramecium octaurelia]|uniref:Uncharacterized protein n=1 Tax=Paramecium octaurelia TaxID=43137 RepID=A0A8S1XEW4_PAROT|nr:unnamed protein product [Paramecium octaurelia]